MKTVVRVFCAFMFLTLSVSLSAQEKTVPKEILGDWNYVMENPQTGESHDGVCTIATKGKETKATFKVGDNVSETSAFRPNDNGKFYCDMELQGYMFGVVFDLKEDKLNCELEISGYILPLEMTKVK